MPKKEVSMNIIKKKSEIDQEKADDQGPQDSGRLIYGEAQKMAESSRGKAGEAQQVLAACQPVEPQQQRGEQKDKRRS